MLGRNGSTVASANMKKIKGHGVICRCARPSVLRTALHESGKRSSPSRPGVQTAVKIVLEPIFEVDFEDSAYGYGPRRGAVDAVDVPRL